MPDSRDEHGNIDFDAHREDRLRGAERAAAELGKLLNERDQFINILQAKGTELLLRARAAERRVKRMKAGIAKMAIRFRDKCEY